ncbi:hypothetical protein [uncultured Cellulomonas sp.]|uniref:hypothetical protein n=1 Tax=uncultured Cellulomonas sp. TaxID=189682 RepID=UPI002617D558|nr:hypothetical protein [uncultured Cellulomonas sp.]
MERRPAGAGGHVGDREYDVASGALVVQVAASHGTAGLLKVLSVLHSRRVTVHRLQYEPTSHETAQITLECSLGPTTLETVRRSVANAVPVLRATARPLPSAPAQPVNAQSS